MDNNNIANLAAQIFANGNSTPQEKLNSIINSMDDSQKDKLQQILNDEDSIKRILSSKKAQEMINKLQNGG